MGAFYGLLPFAGKPYQSCSELSLGDTQQALSFASEQ